MRSSRAGTIALALLLLAWAPVVRAEIVESIPAVVDGRPLLLSEVRLMQQVRGLDPKPALEALIDERLMFREASRLPLAATSAEGEDRAYADLVARNPALADWPAADVRRLVHRQAAILAYIDFRYRPQVRVGEEAIKQAYDAEYAGAAAPPPVESVKEALRQRLAERGLDASIEEWVRELRAGAEIRRNDSDVGEERPQRPGSPAIRDDD